MSTSPDVFTALPLRTLSDARVTAAQEQARALGFSAGYAAGAKAAAQELEEQRAQMAQEARVRHTQIDQELAQTVTAFAAAIQATQDRELPVLDAAQETLCTLALELARSVVDGVIAQPSPVAGVSTGALQALLRAARGASTAAQITVAMAPEQAEQVTKHWDLVLKFLGPTEVNVVPDAQLAPGSAVATYPHGYVDATLESAFERARHALDTGLAQSQPQLEPVEQRKVAPGPSSVPDARAAAPGPAC